MIVVKKLAAKLKIELASELGDSVLDVAGLSLQIFFIIKTDLHSTLLLSFLLKIKTVIIIIPDDLSGQEKKPKNTATISELLQFGLLS